MIAAGPKKVLGRLGVQCLGFRRFSVSSLGSGLRGQRLLIPVGLKCHVGFSIPAFRVPLLLG